VTHSKGIMLYTGEMFSSVVLTGCNEVEEEISLCIPCDEKYYFGELEVRMCIHLCD